MVHRPTVGIGDWLRARAVLGETDAVVAAIVAEMLGLPRHRAEQLLPLMGAASADERGDALQAAGAPAVTALGALEPGRAAPGRGSGAALRVEPLPLQPRVPTMPFGADPLPAPGERIDAPLDPLLDPGTTRALLAALASLPASTGEVDVPALVEALAGARPLRRLPLRRRPSLRRGLQVLIDAAPGMEPFAGDARQLVAELRRLLPAHALQVGHFFGGADCECWIDGAAAEQPWPSPAHGAPLLLLSDLGAGGASDAVVLARAARSRAVPLRVLAPQAPARQRSLHPLPWERSLSLASLRRGGAATPQPSAPESAARRLVALSSLAVRVDMPLLRRLRRTLRPDAGPAAEAAAWLGPWVQVHNADGFVLRDSALPALRAELAADPTTLAVAWEATEALHKGWPASLQLEERLTWLALRGDAVDWDAEWEPVLAAMAASEARAQEIARWAVRAVPRLPPPARETSPARAVLVAAALRIGAPAALLGGTAPLSEQLWPLLPSTLPPPRLWSVASEGGAIVLREPRDGDSAVIELPDTRPPLALLSWALPMPGQALHAVVPGAALPLPADAAEIQIAALDGRRWRVVGDGESDTLPEWARRCTVQFIDGGRVTGLGIAVGQDLVLTSMYVVQKSRRFEVVVIDGERMTDVEAKALKDPMSTLVASRVKPPRRLPTVPLGDQVPSEQDAIDVTVVIAEDGRLVTDGGSLNVGRDMRAGRFDLWQGRRLGSLRLPGSPLIANGKLAGNVAFGVNEAEGVGAIRRFLRWAGRPRSEWPHVAVVGDLDGSTGKEALALLDSVCLERHDGGSDFGRIHGALLVADRPQQTGPSNLRWALRRWADPGFGLAVVSRDGSTVPLPRGWQDAAVVVVRDGENDDPHRAALLDVLNPDRPSAPDSTALRRALQADGLDLGGDVFDAQHHDAVARVLASREPKRARQVFGLLMCAAIPDTPALSTLREAPAVVTLDAAPLQVGRLAIERAWYPMLPPRIVALRDQFPWSSAVQLAHAVGEQAAAALDAPQSAVMQHLRDLPTRYYVVLLQRPPPSPELLLAAKQLLGSAVFVCLVGHEAKAPGHTVLSLGLPEGGLPFVMSHYKPLAQIVAPRKGSNRRPPPV